MDGIWPFPDQESRILFHKKENAMRIRDLTPEALRRFIQSHKETAYRLVDVRQPGEYEDSHIPGAQLLPLPELVQSMSALPPDQDLVFYCRSGARSMAAATMVKDEGVTGGDIFNLAGGILAWDGGLAVDQPRIDLFDFQAPPADTLKRAMNLEKGAFNFYRHVERHYADNDWSEIFGKLSKAEIGHARTVYHFWSKMDSDPPDFDSVFDTLGGDVLEGGISFEKAVDQVSAVQGTACIPLIELALQIEYAAYDLYRTMADRSPAPDARDAFLTLAQAEKNHMQSLIKAIGRCQ
jgi:rhodanese-related sulfurtransferase/rubrerythrin